MSSIGASPAFQGRGPCRKACRVAKRRLRLGPQPSLRDLLSYLPLPSLERPGYFLRVEWDLAEFDLDRAALLREFEPLARHMQILSPNFVAGAVRWHLEHRILCYGNKTVVFD